MDIAGPAPDEQVAPLLWGQLVAHADLRDEVRRVLRAHLEASPNEVVATLAAQGVQVSGVLVCQWLARWRRAADPASERCSIAGPRLSTVGDGRPCTGRPAVG
jgi:hypothetical protein